MPRKVTKQCPSIPGVWGHCFQCPIVGLAAEDDVHTTPYDTRTALRNSNQRSNTVSEMPNVPCGGVCVAPEGDQAVFYHPWDVEALPPMPHGDPTC